MNVAIMKPFTEDVGGRDEGTLKGGPQSDGATNVVEQQKKD